MKKNIDYTVQSFPLSRLFTMDVGRLGLRRHHVKALIEIDITESRKKIKARRAESGAAISFTSWILKCIGRAMSEHPQVHALKRGKSGLIVFKDVDLSIVVEKNVGGVPVPLPLVVRDAANKSVGDIYNEIEAAKKEIIGKENEFVMGQNRKDRGMKMFSLLPQWVRLIVWRLMLRNPHRIKKMMGTAVVTSVGMMGSADGWIVPFSIHPVCFAVGSITRKPGAAGDAIEIREYLKMTILVDHDVIDGAPAARFVSRMAELIEKGYEL